MNQIPKITCPACMGSGRVRYELIPNHPSGRMGIEECAACRGCGEIIDRSKCCRCHEPLTGDENEGYDIDLEAPVCAPCNWAVGAKQGAKQGAK
jgi:DnaJ-class molecular chaperone